MSMSRTSREASPKRGKPIRAELPRYPTPFIDEWLSIYRPILLRDQISDAMWISGYRQLMKIPRRSTRRLMDALERSRRGHQHWRF
jgi:hypothetical protein